MPYKDVYINHGKDKGEANKNVSLFKEISWNVKICHDFIYGFWFPIWAEKVFRILRLYQYILLNDSA